MEQCNDRRPSKIVMEGKINFSFGKNGLGLSDEFIKIGELIKLLSKDNYIYMIDSFIDACDDVYDLKFDVIPHEDNAWMVASDDDKTESLD